MINARQVGVVVGLVVAILAGAAAPAGADVVTLEPIDDRGDVPGWIPMRSNDGGYLIGATDYSGFFSMAWGPDTGSVMASELLLPAGTSGYPSFGAVNEVGVVAGQIAPAGLPVSTRAFVADLHDRAVELLDMGGRANAQITDLNEVGTVVGAIYDGPPLVSSVRAAAWIGSERDLVVLDDLGAGSFVVDVNPSGLASGWAIDGSANIHPVLWDLANGGALVDLAPITGFQVMTGLPVVVNDRGDVLVSLGVGFDGGGASSWGHDVVVEHGTNRLIEPYPVDQGGGSILNDLGQVASLLDPGPGGLGLRYEILDITTGERTVVPAPGESLFRFNDRGQIATTRLGLDNGPDHAVVWDPFRDWIDLGDGGGRGVEVWTMNSAGHLAGTYQDQIAPWLGTVQRAPEPPLDPAAVVDDSTLTVTWQVPVSPGDAPISTYRVLRDGVVVAEVGGSTTTFVEPVTESAGIGSVSAIVAVNEFGESLPSVVVAVAAPVDPAPLPGAGSPAASSPAVAVTVPPTFTG